MARQARDIEDQLTRALSTGAPVHASAASVSGQGVLILGASGTGKSTLCLQLIGLGADLVADDGVLLLEGGSAVRMCCPDAIKGRIEARGLGILAAPNVPDAPLRAVVDLDTRETERMPERRNLTLSGHSVDLFFKVEGPHFPAALLLFLRAGDAGKKDTGT